MQKAKTPWLAAVLNFILPGAGYVYLGNRLRFGVLLLAGMTIALFAPPMEGSAEVAEASLQSYLQDPGFITVMISGLLIAGAFAYDAWSDAKAINRTIEISDQVETEE